MTADAGSFTSSTTMRRCANRSTSCCAAAGLSVRTYDFGGELPRSCAEDRGGCIITDVRMPGLSGMELLRRLQEMRIGLPVIVITGHGDVPLAVEAMKCGAVDFIEKPFDDDVLLAVGARARSTARRKARRSRARAPRFARRIAALTQRERDVLEGLVAGHPNKIIAFKLEISPRTVEIYRANLMTKMKAGSLSELVRMALASAKSSRA